MKHLIVLVLFTIQVSAQQDTSSYYTKTDTLTADGYMSEFDRTYQASITPALYLSDDTTSLELLVVDDLGNIVQGIGEKKLYDKKAVQESLELIERGISSFPDRLDLRIRKINVLKEQEDWNLFTQNIISTALYSRDKERDWKGPDDIIIQDDIKYILSIIQGFQISLFNSGDLDNLQYIRSVAEEILTIYPNHIPSLSNLALTHTLNEQYRPALPYLLKAEKIDSTDFIIQANIAYAYKNLGDTVRALSYYKRLTHIKEQGIGQYARLQLKLLAQKQKE